MKKTIEGFSNYYVTSDGYVYHKTKPIFLCMPLASRGYPRVMLVNNEGVRKSCYVHRLVAQAFIPNSDNKNQVNHRDGNKLNNHYSNLEWCTVVENLKHAYYSGLMDSRLLNPYKNRVSV